MKNETREILELFVLKADLLDSRNFVKHVTEHGTNFNIKWTRGEPVQTTLSIPDEESLAALMLTLRMFIQDNDRISLRNLGKLMDDPGLSPNWKAQINDVRQKNNISLDNVPPIKIVMSGVSPTARDILEVFIYGDMGHTGERKREQFLVWQRDPMVFQLFQHVFNQIVMDLISRIRYIAIMTKKELAGEEVPRLPTEEEWAEIRAKQQAEEDARIEQWQNS